MIFYLIFNIILLCLSLSYLDVDFIIDVSSDSLFYSVVIDYNDVIDDFINGEQFQLELYEIEVEEEDYV